MKVSERSLASLNTRKQYRISKQHRRTLPTDYALEEKVITLRRQLIKAKAKANLEEQRAEEATREMSEMVGHLVRYLGICESSHYSH